ncbi:MAG: ATP-binding protein [Saprospiraceae bacterium]
MKHIFYYLAFNSNQHFLLLFIVFFSLQLTAQKKQNNQPLNLAFEHVGLEDGLNAGDNRFIKKDSKGLVWIGSNNGVFQFDGTSIKKFVSNLQDSTSILDNYIQSDFYEDSLSNIWFSSVKGINVYRRKSDDFKTIQIKGEGGNLLDFSYHIFFLEKNKYLWLRINLEIYRYDIYSGISKKISDTAGINFGVTLDNLGDVNTIYGCPMISQSGFEQITVKKNKAFERKLFWKNGYKNKFIDVRNVIIQNDSTVWLFSKSGLILHNPLSQKTSLKRLPRKTDHGVECGILLDEEHLLLGGASGLWIYDISGFTFTKINTNDKLKSKKSKFENLLSIYLDNQDQLWVSFKNETKVCFGWIYNIPFNKPHQSETNRLSITSVVEDKNAQVWSLDKNNTVYVSDGFGNHLKSFEITDEIKDATNGARLSSTPQGEIFLLAGTEIYQYEFEKEQWINIYNSKQNGILFFKEINSKRIIATTVEGILDLKKNEKNVWESHLYQIPINALSTFQFYTLDNQILFLPTANTNIEIYDISKDTLKLIQKIETDLEVFSMSISSRGNYFWLGTNEGVKVLTKKKDSYKVQNPASGIIHSGLVSNVVEDSFGQLWFTSFEKLFNFNFEKNRKISFGKEDGLSDNSFALHYSTFVGKNNYLWFATNNGSFCFDPQLVVPFIFLPKISIQNFEVNNELVQSFDNNEDRIKLNYYENTLGFVIRSIGTYLPNKNKLFYRCLGYQNDWIKIKSGDKIRFNKLPSGKYELEYFIENANGIKGSIKKLQIEIDTPFWRKWWFLLLCVLGFLILIFTATQVYINEKLKKQRVIIEKQNALQKERNRIASELHDDMGAGLSIIKFLSEDLSLKNKEYLNKKNILRINESAKDLLEKMSEIIWAMNASNDNLENLVAYLCHYFYEYFDAFPIKPTVTYSLVLPEIELSGEKRRNIVLVIKELFHNIVKHAKATEVNFLVDFSDGNLFLIVEDNGVGFDHEKKLGKGNGLGNMKNRISSVNGEIKYTRNNGTKVIVSIPLSVGK